MGRHEHDDRGDKVSDEEDEIVLTELGWGEKWR
jgi:hypothetical protein